MCLRPYIVKNYNRGAQNFLAWATKDVTSHTISVPCGTCPECASMRQTDILERAELATIDHDVYYGTLTYNNKAIPHSRDFVHLDGTVRNYIYAEPDDFRRMIQRIRKENFHNEVPLKYIMVTEYGGRFHRPHIHFLLFVPRKKFQFWYERYGRWYSAWYVPGGDWNEVNFSTIFFDVFLSQWKRNIVKSTKKPVWLPLCTYVVGRDGRSTYDFHYVEPYTRDGKTLNNVAKYVTKYVLKFDKWLDKLRHGIYSNLSTEDYLELWKLLRPKCRISLGLGTGNPEYSEHVRKGIDEGRKGVNGKFIPYFIDLNNGKYMPLGRYLRRKYLTVDDAVDLAAKQKCSQGLTEWDDMRYKDRFFERLEEYNDKYYLDNIESRYRKILDYLDDCNSSEVLVEIKEDDEELINFYKYGIQVDQPPEPYV